MYRLRHLYIQTHKHKSFRIDKQTKNSKRNNKEVCKRLSVIIKKIKSDQE